MHSSNILHRNCLDNCCLKYPSSCCVSERQLTAMRWTDLKRRRYLESCLWEWKRQKWFYFLLDMFDSCQPRRITAAWDMLSKHSKWLLIKACLRVNVFVHQIEAIWSKSWLQWARLSTFSTSLANDYCQTKRVNSFRRASSGAAVKAMLPSFDLPNK